MKKSLLVLGTVLLGVSANAQNVLTGSLFSANEIKNVGLSASKEC